MVESAGATGREDGYSKPIGTVLLVEDNMLIALDTEDALIEAGVQRVVIAASADAALAELAKDRPDFAVLDFNLGAETSERVAAALADQGVPFCYATGYGDAIVALATQPTCGVLKKPYSPADIAEILQRVAAIR